MENSKYYEFYLDSLDAAYSANNGVKATDWPLFQIGGKQPLQNIAAVKILEVQIPFTWYVFNSSNSTFIYQDVFSGPLSVTLPEGNYNASQVATNLQNSINQYNATTNPNGLVAQTNFVYTVTYDSALQKFTVWNNDAVFSNYFSLTFGNENDMVGNTNPALLLGFNPGINIAYGQKVAGAPGTPYGSFLTAPNAMSVTGPNYLYINSLRLGNLTDIYLPQGAENLGGGNSGPQMAKVPINVQPGGVVFWSDPTPDRWFNLENLSNLSEIDFYLTVGNTSAQTPLRLNGQPFSIKMGLLLNEFSLNNYSSGPGINDHIRTRVSKR